MSRSAEPESVVLGQILLMQSTLHVMSDDQRMGEFLSKGLVTIPGVRAVGVCLNGTLTQTEPSKTIPDFEAACADAKEPNAPFSKCDGKHGCRIKDKREFVVIDILTVFNKYGALVFKATPDGVFNRYRPYIESTANLTALILETRAQENLLHNHKNKLELRVENRNRALVEVSDVLAEKEHFIRRIVDTAPTLIYIYDLIHQKNLYINNVVERTLGYTPADIAGMGGELFAKTIHPDDMPKVAAHQKAIVKASDQDILEVEYRIRHKDGKWRILHSFESIFAREHDGAPSQTAGVAIDVTQQREDEQTRAKLEEQLARAQKLESIGQLAGGVAHDFNNLLAPILGYADMLIDDMTEETVARHWIETIRDSAERGTTLTRQLLAVGRKQLLESKPLDLNRVLEVNVEMLRRTIPENISIDIDSKEPEIWVQWDEGQLSQVIINLALNARDAMPKGGQLTFSSSKVPLGSLPPNPIGLQSNTVALLEVRDTGFGMSKEVQNSAFEPFFTTKERSKGSGLGLSSVYGIVRQHGGFAELESEPGTGTVVRIWLRLLEGTKQKADRISEGPKDANQLGNGKILLVEDDETVRSLTAEMLEHLGYTVTIATGGHEALDLFEKAGPSLDTLLTDVIMPEMTGVDLYKQLAAQNPRLKVLFMSGHPASVLEDHDLSPDLSNYLKKPFNLKSLRNKLKAATKLD